MTNTKAFRILALVIVPIILAVAFYFAFSGNQETSRPTDDNTTPSVQAGVPTDPDVTLPTIGTVVPTVPSDPDLPSGPEEIIDDGSGLTPEEPAVTEPVTTNPTQPDENEPVEPEQLVTPPAEDNDGNQGGISIGTGSIEYDCGTEGHNCAGPETHAYILNLELKGCPYCGSDSCPSFYAVDEWGNTCYTPSQCPEYNAHQDPVHYCQECGKACGDGKNDTCVQFVNACACPNCGEYVDSRVCHTCKED